MLSPWCENVACSSSLLLTGDSSANQHGVRLERRVGGGLRRHHELVVAVPEDVGLEVGERHELVPRTGCQVMRAICWYR
jgi:hypothetical protein